jgi:hypothetical protein
MKAAPLQVLTIIVHVITLIVFASNLRSSFTCWARSAAHVSSGRVLGSIMNLAVKRFFPRA